MWRSTLAVICALAQVVGSADDEKPASRLVRTAQGPLKGYKDPDSGLFIFYNIPYATAPVGPYKFKGPLPAPVWFETYEAVDKNVTCLQTESVVVVPNKKDMQESCLVATVYVPDTKERNIPVVVYVHGGSFQIGFGDIVPPKNFAKEKNVIVVTFNYRLGINGFLCLGSDDVPGNAGLKDQIALLKWVNKHIGNFGGNSDDITLAGYSSGSSSVSLLMLSKSARGLFHKAILESGSSIAPFAIQQDPLKNAKAFAKKLNFTNVDDFYALENFYKKLPVQLLTVDTFIDRPDSTFVFVPCVERQTEDPIALDDTPLNIIKSGKYTKVPTLYGFSDKEGLFRLFFFGIWKDMMNADFSKFLPADLKFKNKEERAKVSEKVKTYYFGDKSVAQETILNYIDYFSDIMFVWPIVKEAKLHVEAGNKKLYLYEYSFVDEDLPVIPFTKVKGATHSSQSEAILDGTGMDNDNETKITESFRKMKTVMRDLWYNFIKTGEPVPEGSEYPRWPPAGADRSPYMSLNSTLELKNTPINERALFWEEIYEQYYKQPIPPPAPPARHTEL